MALCLLAASCSGSKSTPPHGSGNDAGPVDHPLDMTGGDNNPNPTDASGTTAEIGSEPDGGGGMPVDQRKTLGLSCSGNDECRSGFCVDGVCCSDACDGACVVCAVSGSVGHCVPAEIGTDPRDRCPDQGLGSCGTDGVCDGAGACRKYPAGVTCQTSTCTGSTMNLASRCDGNGACVPTAMQSCMPFACDPQAKTCRTTCSTDADCAAPNTCVNGSCGKKPLGSACATADQCNSGFCEQGTCCGAACDGTCKSCALPGTAGTCSTVPDGQDPLGQCADSGTATCGTDGTCDGAGACRKYRSGTTCAASACNGGTESGTRRCDGAGACQAGASRPCEPYACGGAGTCLTSCTKDGDCAADFFCIGGACSKKETGAACANPADCASGFCQQGVCCNKQCAGGCRACNLAGFVGVCTPVQGGQDPLNGCADAGGTSCGTDGVCDGNGACRLYASGTMCGAGACSGVTQTPASRCNGQGACVAGVMQSCAPFVCAAAMAACLNTCTSNADCSAGNVCVNGSCGKKPNGAACANGTECGTGNCAQGFCCDSTCTGLCQSCAVTGSLGKCSPVLNGDPDTQGRCTDGGAATCGKDGKCDGQGACRVYNGSTQCAAASCAGATLTLGRSCDGAGTCSAATTVDCKAYQCDPATSACRTSCSADNQCTAPNVCIGGVCRKKDVAAACTSDDQCASGFCQQGVCCSSLCTGTCQSCALPTTAGVCTNVPPHGSSAGACPDEGQPTCKRDGLCDGNGGCEIYAAGLNCGPATCTNATAVGVSTCNGSGACVAGASTSCKPYACGSNGACKTTCAADGDCTSPSFCQAPVCNGGKANGQPCGGSADCQSTFCSPQGVCCDSACNGTCVACNLMNSVGTCKNVLAGQPPVVAGQCNDQGAASCGTDGTCNGSGACRFYATGTTCGASVCSTGNFTPARTCSSAHACQMPGASSCGNFACNATGCLTSCNSDSDCTAPSRCFSTMCGGLKGQYFKLSDPATPSWSGTPANTRVDPNVDFPSTDPSFGFGNGSPFPNDATWPVDNFTVRWTGKLTPRFTGAYTFATLSDDGIRVIINGNTIIDNTATNGGDLQVTSAPINLTANQPVTIQVDYHENTGWAQAHLFWSNVNETNNSPITNCKTSACVIIPTSRLTPDP